MMELYTINQVSKLYGISTRMLYYYEKIGLISSLRKSEYAYRVYDETALLRLQQILILRKLRIPMKQIHIILNNAQTTEAIDLFVHNIQELEEEIKTLAIIRDALSHLVKELKQSSSIHMNFFTARSSPDADRENICAPRPCFERILGEILCRMDARER